MDEKEIIEDILSLSSSEYLSNNENTEDTKIYNLSNSKIDLITCSEENYLKELFSAVQEYIKCTNDLSIKSISKRITGEMFYNKMDSSLLYKIIQKKSVYSLSQGLIAGYKTGIVISMHNITKTESSFILETVSILRRRFNQSIEISNNILYCTHVIIASNSQKDCKLSHSYMLGILFGKAIVNFNWYLELFNRYNIVSVETITLLNTVQADTDITNSSEMACIYGMSNGFFSNLNIKGDIVSSMSDLITFLNGTTDKKSKRHTLKIDTYKELYYFILIDSSNPFYLTIFPERNYIYYI